MENSERPINAIEGIRRRRVAELVNRAADRKDPELCYYCMLVFGEEMGASLKAELVGAIANGQSDNASEFAFKLLRDQRDLSDELRGALLGRIVASGDKTTCSLTLGRITGLGEWEDKLRDVLAQ